MNWEYNPEVRTLALIRSGSSAAWTCSQCDWRWSAEDSASGADMHYAFATHVCEDFIQPPVLQPPIAGLVKAIKSFVTAAKGEECVAVAMASTSLMWTVHLVTKDFVAISKIPPLPPGPAEICAIGALIWLHAKWRRVSAGVASQAS